MSIDSSFSRSSACTVFFDGQTQAVDLAPETRHREVRAEEGNQSCASVSHTCLLVRVPSQVLQPTYRLAFFHEACSHYAASARSTSLERRETCFHPCSTLHLLLTFQANTTEFDGFRLESQFSARMRSQTRDENPLARIERASMPEPCIIEWKVP